MTKWDVFLGTPCIVTSAWQCRIEYLKSADLNNAYRLSITQPIFRLRYVVALSSKITGLENVGLKAIPG